MSTQRSDNVISCSFCGCSANEATSMVAGPDVYICDRCINDAAGIVEGDAPAPPSGDGSARSHRPPTMSSPLPPHEIKRHLDEHVIGQDRAKKTLSVAVYNHYKRINSNKYAHGFDDVELEKSNVLMIGPTGTGKTLLARTLAQVLDVPFSIADATVLTEAGYVGEDVESILTHLLQAADYDVDRAERGIIYLDEVDKVARKSDSASITRDVSGEGVQQALLKLLEGTVAGVSPKGGRKHPEQSLVQIDTSSILFICGGAFAGLDTIVANRLSDSSVGFLTESAQRMDKDDPHILQHAEPSDLLQYGLIPELVGRLPVATALHDLSEEALTRILTDPKNALVKQYKKLFALDGFNLSFEDEALDAIVEQSRELGTGARGLRSALEDVMLEIMFSMHQQQPGSCRITAATVRDGAPPVYEERRVSA